MAYQERNEGIYYDRVKVHCDYDDEAEISFSVAPTLYVVGTNANAALLGSWPLDPVSGLPLADAKNTLFMATKDCFVRFRSPLAVAQRLFAGVYYTFNRRWAVLYVTRVLADGILYAWVEG